MSVRVYAILFLIVFVAGFTSSLTADIVYSMLFLETADDDDTSTICIDQGKPLTPGPKQ